jgi:hypothetical protein
MPDATTPVRTLGPVAAVYSGGGFVPDVGGVVRASPDGPIALISPWPPRLDGAAFVLAVWEGDVVEWHQPGEVFVYRPQGPPSGSLCVVLIPSPVQLDVPDLKALGPDGTPDRVIDEEIVKADWDWSHLLQSKNPGQDFAPLRGSLPAVPPSAASGPPRSVASPAARSPARRTTVEAMARAAPESVLSKLLLRE